MTAGRTIHVMVLFFVPASDSLLSLSQCMSYAIMDL